MSNSRHQFTAIVHSVALPHEASEPTVADVATQDAQLPFCHARKLELTLKRISGLRGTRLVTAQSDLARMHL
jgi:hypothetical protein